MKVDIYVQGGIVQDVVSDHDIEVRVIDYDVEGITDEDDEEVIEDENGDLCIVNDWGLISADSEKVS